MYFYIIHDVAHTVKKKKICLCSNIINDFLKYLNFLTKHTMYIFMYFNYYYLHYTINILFCTVNVTPTEFISNERAMTFHCSIEQSLTVELL